MKLRRPYRIFRTTAPTLVVLSLIAPLTWTIAASLKTNVDIYDTARAAPAGRPGPRPGHPSAARKPLRKKGIP